MELGISVWDRGISRGCDGVGVWWGRDFGRA